MDGIRDLPEIRGLNASSGLIRIPPQVDVPLTPRVKQLIDSSEFRRLAKVSQLGLVGLVYPAANHTRFEHSLGVYRTALLYLNQFANDERFISCVTPEDAELFIAAALLHDVGHWPFCHAIEDMALPGLPDHEHFANSFLLEGEIADALRDDWGINPRDVVSLLSGKANDRRLRVLQSMLSGPIDIDKVDYLQRDSLHAGVPYGNHFDAPRLIRSLCLNEAGDTLGITDKGKTAAEMMVFARYVMFSEVYWHHTVRSATAMLQRAFFILYKGLEVDSLFRMTDHPWVETVQEAAFHTPAADLIEGLFGSSRRLYKQLTQFSLFESPQLYHRLARKPFGWLVHLAEHLGSILSTKLSRIVASHEILVDAPPVELEIEFDLDVYFAKEGCYRRLGAVSPVVRTLAKEQFDDYVKRVRIFAHPRLIEDLRKVKNLPDMLAEALDRMG